jgi:hypothetical protein
MAIETIEEKLNERWQKYYDEETKDLTMGVTYEHQTMIKSCFNSIIIIEQAKLIQNLEKRIQKLEDKNYQSRRGK